MSDFWMLFIAAILSIIAAYGLGFHVGFDRGVKHRYYEDLIDTANKLMEVKEDAKL